MFGVIVKDFSGKHIDIAVEVRFATDLIEVVIDETPETIQQLMSVGEYIYIQIVGPNGIFGQATLAELEIELGMYKGNQIHQLNAVTTGR